MIPLLYAPLLILSLYSTFILRVPTFQSTITGAPCLSLRMWISELLECRGVIRYSNLGLPPTGEGVKNLLGQMRLRLEDFVEEEPPASAVEEGQAQNSGMSTELRDRFDDLTGLVEKRGKIVAKNNRRVVYPSNLIQAQSDYINGTRASIVEAFENLQDDGALITANQAGLHHQMNRVVQRQDWLESKMIDKLAMVKSLHDLFGAPSTSPAATTPGRPFALPHPSLPFLPVLINILPCP
ncbi:hypothetical protein RND81_12G022600 [Saponaria officinalis]|uniref:Uncharacterized protein n=1 Tax=Saponaria officinalis TaxID=3572 RepID=A0AAW1H2A8_SAPOF